MKVRVITWESLKEEQATDTELDNEAIAKLTGFTDKEINIFEYKWLSLTADTMNHIINR